jgi:hypothetical protein
MTKLDEFTAAYLACLFEETVEEGPMSDGGYGPIGDDFTAEDIDPKSLDRIVADCQQFQEQNAVDIATWSSDVLSDSPAELAGRCFLESRNGWCGGFLGGDWPGPQGSRLAAAAKKFSPTVTHISEVGVVSLDLRDADPPDAG